MPDIMKRVALITGGSRGIGLGVALQLAANGFNLAINGTRPAGDVEEVIKKFKSSGTDVIYCQGDISSLNDRQKILLQVKNYYNCLHVLVNNAGIAPKERKDI